jgi:hypothetical protein
MLPQHATRLAVAILAALVLLPVARAAEPKAKAAETMPAATPACPEGQTMFRGACVQACPTTEPFNKPDGCECPAGYGKILSGDGNGQCHRVLCPGNSPFEPARDCECPHNMARTKPNKAGMVTCVLQKDKAVPKQKAR